MGRTWFPQLHVHDHYSVKDGCATVETYAEIVAGMGGRALAVTNHGMASGYASQFFACKEHKIKPIYGMEAYINNHRKKPIKRLIDELAKKKKKKVPEASEKLARAVAFREEQFRPSPHAIILAKTREGYRNLVRMSTDSWANGLYYKPRTDVEFLADHREGLVYSTACIGGYIPRIARNNFAKGVAEAKRLQGIFGRDFYVEIMITEYGKQRETNKVMIKLAHEIGAEMIVTCDVHYANPSDGIAQDVLLLMRDKKTLADKAQGTEEIWQFEAKDLWWRSLEDVLECWKNNHSDYMDRETVTRAIKNTYRLADEIEHFDFDCSLKLPGVFERPEATLRELAISGMREKLRRSDCPWGGKTKRDYAERLQREMKVVNSKGFAEYYLLVRDVCKHAREIGARLGPGRGCLRGDVPIVMVDGHTKPISEVEVGERVRSHTGVSRKVTKIHRYETNESLLKINCAYGSKGGVVLTRDHEVLVEKAAETENYKKYRDSAKRKVGRWIRPTGDLEWRRADQVKVGDWVLVPAPQVDLLGQLSLPSSFDLAEYVDGDSEVCEEVVIEKRNTNQKTLYSKRDVSRKTGVSRNSLGFMVSGSVPKRSNPRHELAKKKVLDYVGQEFGSLEEWGEFLEGGCKTEVKIRRRLVTDAHFLRFVGFWLANGWLRSNSNRCLGVAFHSEAPEVQEATEYLESLGLKPTVVKAPDKALVQITVFSSTLVSFWRTLFPDYRQKAQTKEFPQFCLGLPHDELKHVLVGYLLCDGHHGENKIRASTSSKGLADRLRFLAWRSGLPASLSWSDRFDERFGKTYRGYTVDIPKSKFLGSKEDAQARYRWHQTEKGVLCQVSNVESVEGDGEVYDLTVEVDHSYQTDSFAVHNSVGGSLLAWVLGITEVDPLRFGLLFERFLDESRPDPPDIDLDFSPDHRGEIKKYIEQRYPATATIGSYNTFKPRAILTDVGKVYGADYRDMLKITKPLEGDADKKTWDEICEEWEAVDEWAKENPEAFGVVKTLRGLISHQGKHAAAMLIAPASALDEIPMTVMKDSKTKESTMVTAFPDTQGDGVKTKGREISRLGYLKLDILGVESLNVAPAAIEILERETGEQVVLEEIPLDDPKTLKVASTGDVPGMFQFDTSTTKPIMKRVGIDSFMDLVMVTGLARPGPLKHEVHEEFARLKRGDDWKEDVPEDLVGVLEDSRGLMILQEDVMAVLRAMGGFTGPEANAFRKIVSKKHPEAIKAWRDQFVQGGIDRGYSKDRMEDIWGKAESMAGYAFPKAHSVEYCMTSFRQCYMLVHHPLYYFGGLLATTKRAKEDSGGGQRIIRFMRSAMERGIEVKGPHLIKSEVEFDVKEGAIRFGLSKIKGVANAAAAIVEARPYSTFEEFFQKVNKRSVNLGKVKALIYSGALDEIPYETKCVICEDVESEPLSVICQECRDEGLEPSLAQLRNGALRRYHELREDKGEPEQFPLNAFRQKEREALGIALSWWASNDKGRLRDALGLETIKEAKKEDMDRFAVVAEVVKARPHKSKRGTMAFLAVADETGTLDNMVLWSQQWGNHKKALKVGNVLVLRLKREESKNRSYGRWTYYLNDSPRKPAVESVQRLLRSIR